MKIQKQVYETEFFLRIKLSSQLIEYSKKLGNASNKEMKISVGS